VNRLAHHPALDGLRGLAVAGVVLFHAGYAWAVGGFLGVSTFFTLSGFLITSLLLAERAETGRIALGAFWARRARRLLPAALTTLVAVGCLASWLATPEQLASLRGDVLAALLYGANRSP
jgi:peptidoglycan/LPS O-acetylase OafA/YrhL